MSDEYKVEIDTEAATATFKIDIVGTKTQESYKGVFTVKCMLNPMDFINADKTYRQLVGGDPKHAHEHANGLAFALAQLKYRMLKEAPFWTNHEFPGSHVEDNIIIEVLNRALFCEEKFISMKKSEVEAIEKELTDDIMGGLIKEIPELEGMESDDLEDPTEVEID